MASPRRPTVLRFLPYTDSARVCASKVLDFDVEAISDVHYELRKVSDGSLITSSSTGAGDRNFTISSLALAAGVVYSIRLRYENASGTSAYSQLAYGRVPPAAFAGTPIAVPGEPTATETIPIDPEFGFELEATRYRAAAEVDTGHILRRPRQTLGRRRAALEWRGLSETDRDTLLAFIRARFAAGDGFLTSEPVLGVRKWFPRDGRLEFALVGPNEGDLEFMMSLDATEILG